MQIIAKRESEEELENKVALGDENVTRCFLAIENFDNEPGYYQCAVRPLLNPGHEDEMYEWLKEIGLIQRTMRCINSERNMGCSNPMQWKPADQNFKIDKFMWKCKHCKSKKSIREESFFKQVKCSIDTVFRIILGWCKNIDANIVSQLFDIKPFYVNRVYDLCGQIADMYVNIHMSEWQLGGDDVIVLIDVFPNDVRQPYNDNRRNNNVQRILTIAEVKEIPTRFFYHVLENKADDGVVKATIDEGVRVVTKMVRPGSIIVLAQGTTDTAWQYLYGSGYPVIISTNELSKFDTPAARTALDNIETVWRPAVKFCEEVQDAPKFYLKTYIKNQLWRQRYAPTASQAFESILHHISVCWSRRM